MDRLAKRGYLLLLLSLIQVVISIDHNQNLFKVLSESGLVSDHVKRSISQSSNRIAGITSSGCPISIGSRSHSISRRSLKEYESAEGVLAVYSTLVEQHGIEKARSIVKRSVDFRQFNCLDGWAPCDLSINTDLL
ncbi:hypothetical protein EB796_019813 [Bugula neritina]|uniref:Uncharacterized protein n=1 Tax=Bugula neritina TaxID=10212 RepID=A0A7J7J7G6_BUGNE|nr:hypothetical protein EB796_019813 [Bugula neritina]